jgi:hypothetical protein
MGRVYATTLFASLNYRASSATTSDAINSTGSGMIDIAAPSILWHAEPSRSQVSQVPVAVRLEVERRASMDHYTAGPEMSVRTTVMTEEAAKGTS